MMPSFYWKTWAGRIIVINFVLFAWLSYQSKDILSPSLDYIIALGAKEPVLIAKGAWWRLVFPLFLHVGFIHFILNNLALRTLGRVLEPLLAKSFLFIYIGGGIAANIASSYRSLVVGAGASGAIFALVGVGWVFEWYFLTVRKEYPFSLLKRVLYYLRSPFSFVVFLNFALTFLFNLGSTHWDLAIMIDNDAHLGGLVFGVFCGLGLLLSRYKRWHFSLFAAISALLLVISAWPLVSGSHIKNLFLSKAKNTENSYEQFYYLSKALEIDSEDLHALVARASIAALHSEVALAVSDLMKIKDKKVRELAFVQLKSTLLAKSKLAELSALERIFLSLEK